VAPALGGLVAPGDDVDPVFSEPVLRAAAQLDAWRDNEGLHAYYRDRGFTHLRTVEAEGRRSGALFQRPAGQVQGIGPSLAVREA